MIEVVTTRIGLPSFERLLGPIFARPDPHIATDAAIDMRRQAQQDPGKIWWLAVADGVVVVAQAAIWPVHRDPVWRWESGSNYEHGWRTRAERWWPLCHAARQAWLAEQQVTRVMTWLHDNITGGRADVVRHHLDTGWILTGEEGPSHDIAGQWCVQMAWRP